MKKKMKYILIGFVVLIVFGAILSSSDSSSTSTTKDKVSDTSTTQQEAPKEVQQVEIASFIKDFDDNQLSAEEKYDRKYIGFTGYIDNISEDILGSPFLAINPTSEEYYFGTHIQCMFEDKSSLTSLKNGEKVSLQGQFKSQTLGSILVENCEVVSE